jgi:hypothetical protein
MSATEQMPTGLAYFFIVLASAFMFWAGAYVVGPHRFARMYDRCQKACSYPPDDVHWSDDTHVCACPNGSVHHIRTVVEVVRAKRPEPAR